MVGVSLDAVAVAPPCAGLACFVPETAPGLPVSPADRADGGAGVDRDAACPRRAAYFEVRFWTVSASKSESFSVTVLSYGLSSFDIAVTK